MSRANPVIVAGFICLITMGAYPAYGQLTGGDLLNEAPLTKIPEEMTFEEYQDMNRRLTVGLVLAAIPVPGMIHFYAGEKKTGWLILGTAAASVGAMLAGALVAEEDDFPESDFDLFILNPGDKEKERRFEKIPIEVANTDTTYRLREIFREADGAGIALIALGAAILVGDIVYDFMHGVRVIEEKRDRVRFKYGKTLSIGFKPEIDPINKAAGFTLAVDF